jgi:multiple sugar transport system substrate-binding protein
MTLTAKSTAPLPEQKLTIWWTQGFLPEENQVIARLVSEWQKATGLEANLVMLPDRDILQDTLKATEEGRAPDILFSFAADTNLIPLLAWQGKLADLSHLVSPFKPRYSPAALEAVYYQNNVSKQRSYYAIPFGQNTVHLHYWRNQVEAAGFKEEEIPQQWDQFWSFWQQTQTRLRQKGQQQVYGLGLTLSDLGTDTFWEFEHFLEAYDVKVIDDQGQLSLDNPDARAGITKTLRQFASFYQNGNVPPKAVEWTDSGNNVSFLEGESVMTANSTLSIPFTQKQPQNSYNQLSNDLYFNKIRTIGFPHKPDGQPLRSILSIKQVVMFKDTPHQQAAESFLSYFSKPQTVNQFLQQAMKGRIFPVMPELLKDPFWNNPHDPHLSVALKQYEQATRPSYQVYAPAYSQVLKNNIWAKAILRVVEAGASPEQATDEAIADIKQIFAEWS